MTIPLSTQAALAAHRFGLGEPDLEATVRGDARGWLLAQIGAADQQAAAPGAAPLASAAVGLRRMAEFTRLRRERRAPESMSGNSGMPGMAAMMSSEQAFGEHFRVLVQADTRARLVTAATTARPFAERLALFWSNHFTVSMAKASARGLVGAFEREAIRPRIAGRFEDLLRAATMHPAMLRYLDNEQSAGPRSRVVQRLARAPRDDNAPGPRVSGLNENLAREVLELHTLGAEAARAGVYTQADVTAFAAVLTGWRVPLYAYAQEADAADAAGAAGAQAASTRQGNDLAPLGDASPTRFDRAWHEPGPKTVLGQRITEGAEGLGQVLGHLARHPATARFIATKLVRHFVADEPPAALVDRVAARFLTSEGDLSAVYRELLDAPEAWQPRQAKFKSPEEMVLSTARLLRFDARAFERQPDGGIGLLGQRVQAAPSPAGWPDKAEEWLGPDAVWKRVEWATRVADRAGAGIDARALASRSLGPLLSADSARQIERAADGRQALALLLLTPEFQRR
jgi:uncharacterized protein (DUF1800 family)